MFLAETQQTASDLLVQPDTSEERSARGQRWQAGTGCWLVLGGLVVLTTAGFSLRVVAAQQSLFGDELYTYAIVTRSSVEGVLDGVHATENTPPLFYLLSWLSAKIGDPTVWLRLPSVVFGSAAILVTYLLGSRLSGRRTGLLAAALLAFTPAAIYYGSEARAYGLLMFFVVLSTLALLRALDGERRWWFVYWLAATGAIYTHYSVVFALAAQVSWALWHQRSRWRALLLANLAVVVAYLPWLPNVGRNPDIFLRAEQHPVVPTEIAKSATELFPGRPVLTLGQVPGELALIMLALGAAVAVAGLLLRYRGDRSRASQHPGRTFKDLLGRSELLLPTLLLFATPAGIIVYSVLGTSLLAARNFTPALPYLCIVGAAVVLALRWPLATAVGVLSTVALIIGGLGVVSDSYRRPPFEPAADLIEEWAGPETRILQFPSFPTLRETDLFPSLEDHPLRQDLAIHLSPRHRSNLRTHGSGWPDSDRVLVVSFPKAQLYDLYSRAAAGGGARLTRRVVLPGAESIAVSEYRRDTPEP